MKIFKSLITLSIICCIISLSACGKTVSIAGEWEYYVPVKVYNSSNIDEYTETTSKYYICFNNDGTGYYNFINPSYPDWKPKADDATNENFTYVLEKDQLLLTYDSGEKQYYKYEISDSSIKLTNDMKAVFVLNRKTK